MNLIAMTAAAVAIAAVVAFMATATASSGARRRSVERRRRYVQRHPGLVNLGDSLDRAELEVLAGLNHPELFAGRPQIFA